MTEIATQSKRQTSVDRYLMAAHVGVISLVVLFVFYFGFFEESEDDISPLVSLPLGLVAIASFWSTLHLVFKRHADEYTEALWHSGVTWAFVMLIIYSTLGLTIGFIAELLLTDINAEDTPIMDEMYVWLADVCIAAFFAGFYYKRWKGY